jgi:hypothetical protein
VDKSERKRKEKKRKTKSQKTERNTLEKIYPDPLKGKIPGFRQEGIGQ